jgi:hypothetical protein
MAAETIVNITRGAERAIRTPSRSVYKNCKKVILRVILFLYEKASLHP